MSLVRWCVGSVVAYGAAERQEQAPCVGKVACVWAGSGASKKSKYAKVPTCCSWGKGSRMSIDGESLCVCLLCRVMNIEAYNMLNP